ncbi:hypothetical protein AJ79_05251 [Helicocarpus griseus UAMH5409]|uniref:protein-histidine N-methyltransferase n=1 Tax=Helicocarpus griseus UAMH5409 TaxID=1447875 RepID=A0A2B7XQ98_9EURO|nr:hypothetical protein AJ79_05251 [Helicocarpus griseus UAMH5409]
MSTFTFGFAGDDIDDQDVDIDESDVAVNDGIRQLDITDKNSHGNEGGAAVLKEASYCDLDEMLSTLPSQISYSRLAIFTPSSGPEPQSVITIPRREVFDIRAQLMAEDDADTNENAELISGLEKGDLNPTVYEGGLKTWECAIDLAKLVAAEEVSSLSLETTREEGEDVCVIELGAGTAIPSLAILHRLLSQPAPQSPAQRSIRFVFADYNAAVLRLVTVPNILLTWHTCRRQNQPEESQGSTAPNSESGNNANADNTHQESQTAGNKEDDDDLDIDQPLLTAFREDLHARGISLSFISGAWSPTFVDLALPNQTQSPSLAPEKQPTLLILASETIYSPSSLRPFSETLLSLLRRGSSTTPTSGTQTESKAKALIAAKKVYFGVGGGVDEWLHVMRDVARGREGGAGDRFWVKERVDVRSEGVGRVVLEIGI